MSRRHWYRLVVAHDAHATGALPAEWFAHRLEAHAGELETTLPQGSHGVIAVVIRFTGSGQRAAFAEACHSAGCFLVLEVPRRGGLRYVPPPARAPHAAVHLCARCHWNSVPAAGLACDECDQGKKGGNGAHLA